MPKLLTQLINLDGSNDRLASADAQLRAAGLTYVRFPAVDGRGKDPRSVPGYDERRAVSFYGRPMTGGELGCYLSHLACAQAFLQTDAQFGLVVEDDVKIPARSSEVLFELLDWLEREGPTDWDVINLSMPPKKFMSPIRGFGPALDRHTLCWAHYFPVTTTALLWSRPGAQRFVDTAGTLYAPVDHFFRRWQSLSGRGMALSPPLYGVTGATSDLDAEGGDGPARKRIPRTLSFFLSEFRRQSANYLGALWNMAKRRLRRQ